MNPLFDLGYDANDLTVKVSELLVATADGSDELIDNSVLEVLRLLRERMNMDVVFVSEFTDGQRVFRKVETTPENGVIAVNGSDPLEATWCQRVVDGRLPPFIPDASQHPVAAGLAAKLPFRIGTHMSAPIVLKNGEIYGTLCCFSMTPLNDPDPKDLKRLQYTAQLTAEKIERSRASRKAGRSPA